MLVEKQDAPIRNSEQRFPIAGLDTHFMILLEQVENLTANLHTVVSVIFCWLHPEEI